MAKEGEPKPTPPQSYKVDIDRIVAELMQGREDSSYADMKNVLVEIVIYTHMFALMSDKNASVFWMTHKDNYPLLDIAYHTLYHSNARNSLPNEFGYLPVEYETKEGGSGVPKVREIIADHLIILINRHPSLKNPLNRVDILEPSYDYGSHGTVLPKDIAPLHRIYTWTRSFKENYAGIAATPTIHAFHDLLFHNQASALISAAHNIQTIIAK